MKPVTESEVNIPEVVNENPIDLFNSNRVEQIVKHIETEVLSIEGLDPSNPKDYKLFGSIGSKISKTKVALDKAGESIVKPLKMQCKEVDQKRKFLKDRLDALRIKFLAPRTSYDNAEAARILFVENAFKLFAFGYKEIGQFSKPTEEDFEALRRKMDEIEIDLNVFKDKSDEALEAKRIGVENLTLKKKQWKEEQIALEAGRKAIKEAEEREKAKVAEEREALKKEREALFKQKQELERQKLEQQKREEEANSPIETQEKIDADIIDALESVPFITNDQIYFILDLIKSKRIPHVYILLYGQE